MFHDAATETQAIRRLFWLGLASAALLAGGCDIGVKGKAKDAVRAQLVDPDSAQFKDIQADGVTVCGFVNAKNRMGGYTGLKRFVYIDVGDTGSVTIEQDSPFDTMGSGVEIIDIMWEGCDKPGHRR